MKNRRFKINPKKQIGSKSNTPLFIFVSFAAILSLAVLGYLKLSDHKGDAWIGVLKKERVGAFKPTPPQQERLKQKVLAALPDGGKT